MPDKKDITNREDLLLLMQEFYKKLLTDDSINYLFTDIAKINLSHHLPGCWLLDVGCWMFVCCTSKTQSCHFDPAKLSTHCPTFAFNYSAPQELQQEHHPHLRTGDCPRDDAQDAPGGDRTPAL